MDDSIIYPEGGVFYNINLEYKLISINDLYVVKEERNKGIGTKLLNELKIKYPDFTIQLIANPTEFEIVDELTDKESEKFADLYQTFMEHPEYLLEENQEWVKYIIKLLDENKRKRNVFWRLFKFYRKNYFKNISASLFVSEPPHRIVKI